MGAVSDAIQMQKEWSFTRTCPLLTALFRKVHLPGVTQRTSLCWVYIPEEPEIRLLEISAALSSCRIQTSCQKVWEEKALRKRTTVVFACAKLLMRAKMLIGDVNFHWYRI